MKQFILRNGISIPSIGFGTWKIPDGEASAKAVQEAISVGYRHLDLGAIYGNETGVGLGIRASGLDREQLFVTDKLWNSDRGYNRTIEAFQKSLDLLKLDFLDMYLMHWPASPALYENWQDINLDTWRAFEYLYKQGYVKAIGVCNFFPHHLEALINDAAETPMVDQIEYHPGQTQHETVDFCKLHNIQVEAWSPLGSGKMLKKDCLKNVAAQYGVSVARLCIKWCLQNGIIPLPKSVTLERICENYNVFDFVIAEDDMNVLNNLPYIGGSGLNPDEITLFG